MAGFIKVPMVMVVDEDDPRVEHSKIADELVRSDWFEDSEDPRQIISEIGYINRDKVSSIYPAKRESMTHVVCDQNSVMVMLTVENVLELLHK